MKRVVLALMACFATHQALAQTRTTVTTFDAQAVVDAWSGQTGIVVAPSVRDQLYRELLGRVGFSPQLALQIPSTITVIEKRSRFGTGGGRRSTELRAGPYVRQVGVLGLREQVSNAYSIATVGPWLQQKPVLRIAVVPRPPAEYEIQVNDTPLRLSSTDTYTVLPGSIRVKLMRSGMQDCTWSLEVRNGQSHPLECVFK
jgi:hypothetical protein